MLWQLSAQISEENIMLGQFLWMSGRNGRAMYWMISLVQVLVLGIFVFVASIAAHKEGADQSIMALLSMGSFLPVILASAWIGWMNMIRRYHDRGKSGWWALMAFLPIIGPIWQFIELGFLPGEESDNQWGPPPGSVARRDGLDNEIAGMSGGGAMSKLDDNYMAEYARKIALQQAQAQSNAASSSFGGGSSAPVFGKR
jgi:uncharacterized membrane protein YhaH (DUF805 family)